jgi:hypothetical protein
VINQILASGGSQDLFYCPSNPDFDCTNTWNFGIAGTGNDGNGGFRIIGYIWLLPGGGLNINSGTPETPYWRTNVIGRPGPSPGDAQLSVDVVVQDPDGNWGKVTSVGGLPATVIQRSNHLNGIVPAGANEMFEDGHVEWRLFRTMSYKKGVSTVFINVFGGGGAPLFVF